MTIDVNKKYMLTGGQIEDLASRLTLTGEEIADKAEKAQTGSTAPTTSTPGEIGQLYIQSDGTVYILKSIVEESGQPDEYTWEEVGAGIEYTAGDGIDISAQDVISATNTGKARVLTSADYNWPTANPDGIALWLLDAGFYKGDGSVRIYPNIAPSDRRINDASSYLIMKLQYGSTGILCSNVNRISLTVTTSDGVRDYSISNLLTESVVQNNLTSTFAQFPLSANQGRVLKNLVDSLAIRGAGAPTTSTVGQVGTLYEDTTNGDLYICTDAANPYVWEEVGGSSVNVVQSPGTSRTDVMSQYAATKLVYPDYSSTVLKAIRIIGSTSSGAHSEEVTIGYNVSANAGRSAVGVGYQSNNNGERSVAIGNYARATGEGAIAIGEGSYASTRGEMNIGTTTSSMYSRSYGYNNSPYRLLTGLYDPQSDHDAATKGYVDNSLLGKQDALTAGSGISIADESGSLVISTTVAEPDEFTSSEWNALWS